MKKIIYLVLFLSLATMAYANGDALYDYVYIPAYKADNPRQLYAEQNTTITEPEQTTPSTLNYEEIEELTVPKYVSGNIYEPVMNMLGKFKNKIKVVYTDFDGIIVPLNYKDVVLRDSIYNALSKLENNDITVIFTTGRTYREAKRLATNLNMEPDYYITQNGAEVVDKNGVLVYDESFDKKMKFKLNHEVKWFNMIYNQDLKIAFYINGEVYVYRNSNIPDLIDIPTEIDLYSQLPKENASMVRVYCEEPQTMSMFKRYMQRTYPKLHIDSVSENVIDITAENATKANAVKFMSRNLDVDLENTAAFGTYESEIGLMHLIRTKGGLAISNEGAVQKVKAESSYITKDVENDGFSFAVDTILGNNFILDAEDDDEPDVQKNETPMYKEIFVPTSPLK